jgi:protease I
MCDGFGIRYRRHMNCRELSMHSQRHALEGKRIAILVADGLEQVEMTKPREALDEAGARTDFISPMDAHVRGFNHLDPADEFPVQK